LVVTILGKSKEMLAFADTDNSPIIVVNRKDIAPDDFSAIDSASGILQRNGNWEILTD
ncbi:TPA: ABC transporter ATP-binding protein, partial [Streptococcus suis]